MRLILLGRPGAGKGTQASKLAQFFNIPQISTSDMLRTAIAEGTELGNNAQRIIASGKLVSDPIIISLVKERLTAKDCENGFLFDGFPRTIAQAEALKQMSIKVDHVIEIAISDNEIIHRLSGRRVHPPSGRIYHITLHPPLHTNCDDVTGETLVQRVDDQEETIRERLNVYHQQTEPLLTYYKTWYQEEPTIAPVLHHIDGIGNTDVIFKRILSAIDQVLDVL